MNGSSSMCIICALYISVSLIYCHPHWTVSQGECVVTVSQGEGIVTVRQGEGIVTVSQGEGIVTVVIA